MGGRVDKKYELIKIRFEYYRVLVVLIFGTVVTLFALTFSIFERSRNFSIFIWIITVAFLVLAIFTVMKTNFYFRKMVKHLEE